jgi:hypothetical protein
MTATYALLTTIDARDRLGANGRALRPRQFPRMSRDDRARSAARFPLKHSMQKRSYCVCSSPDEAMAAHAPRHSSPTPPKSP